MSETKSPGSWALRSGVKSVNSIRVAGNELAQDLGDLEKRRGTVVADVQDLADGAPALAPPAASASTQSST